MPSWRRPSRVLAVGIVAIGILVPMWQIDSSPPPPSIPRPFATAEPVVQPTPVPARGPCELQPSSGARRVSDDLLANRYTLARFRTFTLPADPRWNENPARDPNWEFNLHTLRFVEALWRAWDQTADRRYLDRSEFILRDWYRDNPRHDPPSRFSWNDHSAAWRGIVYACALRRLPGRNWLLEAALLHARTLADDRFYVRRGNHALNQAIGLLALGCQLRIGSWRSLAERRIERLVVESVDGQGVTNEQAIGYQWYNYARYSAAAEHLHACGMTPSRELAVRVARMPAFLAFGALPNAAWELVGDTQAGGLHSIPGTAAEFVASGGARGFPPSSPFAVFDAGFAFLRSGWGADRPLTDETAVCARFGPARAFHGHRDAASLTLYANGDRILLDPGMYHYKRDAWRAWFRSGPAHNTIEVAGLEMREAGATRLTAERHGPAFDFLALRHHKIPGVDHRRRILYSRRLGVMIVEDDVRAASPRTVRQWWHLHPKARPAIEPDGFFTGRPGSRANVWVVQLDGPARERMYRGSVNPRQGWVSFDYGQRVPAPAIAASKTARHVRFFTLIVPSEKPLRAWKIRSFLPQAEGFDLVLSVGGSTERLWVRGDDAATRAL